MRLFIPAIIVLLSTTAYPQAADTPYQTRYASNLKNGDSLINITNTGASSTTGTNGILCANVYVFSPDNTMVSCCSCGVSPNALVSLSVKKDVLTNLTNPAAVPSSATIKVLSTLSPSSGTSTTCTGTAGTAGTGSNVLATGMAAWGTTVHLGPPGVTETAFTPSTLSAAELSKLNTSCSTIIGGSGAGICKPCRVGGLSAKN